MIEHIFKTTSARDFKFGTQLCMWNAEQAHKYTVAPATAGCPVIV